MPSPAFSLQVVADDLWASQSRAKVGGRAWAVLTLVADLESIGKALEGVGHEIRIGVSCEEGSKKR